MPARTNKTDLTDDELLLFDFLFNCNADIRFLYQDRYATYMNVRYTHGLPEPELRQTIGSLVSRGLWRRIYSKRFPETYGLTSAGGHTWELEREPRWTLYCRQSYYYEEQQEFGSLESPSLQTAQTCYDVVSRLRWNSISNPTTIHHKLKDNLIPWQTFPEVYEIRFLAGEPSNYDWAEYDRRRTWWETVSELDGLKRPRE